MNSNWSYSPETPNLGQIRWFFYPCDLEIWLMTLKNNRAPLLSYFKLCVSFHTHWWMNSNWSFTPETPNLGKIQRFFLAVWPSNLTDDLKNNRAPLLCYFKLHASFCSHWWIQAGVTVRKRPIWVKIIDFCSRVTFKLDGWPWKTIGHLFYATSSFVHHFVPIGELKL